MHTNNGIISVMLHAQIYILKTNWFMRMATYVTLDRIKKERLSFCYRRKNETVFEFLAVGNRPIAVLLYIVKCGVNGTKQKRTPTERTIVKFSL